MRVEGVDDAEDVQQELVRICREEIYLIVRFTLIALRLITVGG